MKLYAQWAVCFAAFLTTCNSQAGVIFSEYVEGSSNNKAIELFNPDSVSLDLGADGYQIQIYFNGNAVAGQTISLTGAIAAGQTFVLSHSSAAAAILALADQTSGGLSFNGDDALVLLRGGVVLDRIGQVGFDPGSAWGSGLTSTANHSLRRKADVVTGDIHSFDPFDPSLQWDGFAVDSFDGLGAHSVARTVASVPAPGTLGLFLLTLCGLFFGKRPGRRSLAANHA
jgi:uncharacterized protein